jgi:multicomponent Na+:H+ antiporter subunit G
VTGVLDALAAALLISGALLTLTAAIGVLRFHDVLTRMHAATKPQVVGLLLALAGAAIRLRSSVDVWMLVLTGAFQLVTAPVAAHIVGRLAYRTRHVRDDLLLGDDLNGSSAEPADPTPDVTR